MITQLTAKRGAQPALDAHRAPLTLYWVFWLFLIAGVAGDLVEIVFWLVTRGELTSRSSLIYGQFSIVWGAGAVLLTLVFHRMDSRSTPRIFLAGTLLGGVYEYVCSLLQEKLFGACFWDYRHLPFNLNGRVNLLFCLFWGAAAVLWVRAACPALYRFVARIPPERGRRIAAGAAAFLVLSTAVTAAALGAVSRFLDAAFPDHFLHARYPNMGILSEIGWYD